LLTRKVVSGILHAYSAGKTNAQKLKISTKFNVYGSQHCNNILIHIQQDATLHSLFYLETVLHVLGGAITHHQ